MHEEGNLLAKKQCIRGDADTAIKNSKYVVTRHYSLPFTDHAFMEPECAIAFPEGEDGVHLYTSGQSVYDEQREISGILQIPQEKVVVEYKLVGGGFGGKEDVTVQHHAALCAWILEAAGESTFFKGGEPDVPCEASCHGNGLHHCLR